DKCSLCGRLTTLRGRPKGGVGKSGSGTVLVDANGGVSAYTRPWRHAREEIHERGEEHAINDRRTVGVPVGPRRIRRSKRSLRRDRRGIWWRVGCRWGASSDWDH